MGPDAVLVIAPLVGVLADMLVHIGYNWTTGGRRLLWGFLAGLLVGWSVQLAITLAALSRGAWPLRDAIGLAIVNQFTFLAMADLYIHAINILIFSLRVRVLHELFCAPEGLTREEILEHYNATDLVRARLERLVAGRQLIVRDGRYYTRPCAMLLLGKLYRLLKAILLRKRAGRCASARP